MNKRRRAYKKYDWKKHYLEVYIPRMKRQAKIFMEWWKEAKERTKDNDESNITF